jgi:hypothetical protein
VYRNWAAWFRGSDSPLPAAYTSAWAALAEPSIACSAVFFGQVNFIIDRWELQVEPDPLIDERVVEKLNSHAGFLPTGTFAASLGRRLSVNF